MSLAKPTPQQAAWHDLEVGMFIHFAPNTWQDREYDDLSTLMEEINPHLLDADRWVDVAESMGAKYIVFVAKHTGGFCLWQTDTTDYSIKSTPWRGGKGDVLADLVGACKRRGMKLGVYLSPQDVRHGAGLGGRCSTPQGQLAYDRLFRWQLSELLSRYGQLIEIWFDGSLVVDVADLIERYAPKSMRFQGKQATIRWVGNESGIAPYPAWNSLPSRDAATGIATALHGDPDGDAWMPLEVDVPIRNHYWFYRKDAEGSLRSLDDLLKLYYGSVGRGGVMLLNHTPDPTGTIPVADAARAAEFGKEISRRFGMAVATTRAPHAGDTVEIDAPAGLSVDHVILMEEIRKGERVRKFVVEGLPADVPAGAPESWRELVRGSAIGHKRIAAFAPVRLAKARLRVLESKGQPQIRSFALYATGSSPPTGWDAPTHLWANDAAGSWDAKTLGPDWSTLDFNLSRVCAAAAQYRLRFVPTSGGIDIKSVVLHFAGADHPEMVVPTDRPNVFTLTLHGLASDVRAKVVARAPGNSVGEPSVAPPAGTLLVQRL
ncbi:MAG: alpha-L-fucosidase [Planctomycetota bacterium]|nr:alpha-L-fucosidase [Planctomycetota bacterium]